MRLANLFPVVAVVAVVAFLSGCSDGRKSATLDRKTALLLLNQTPQIFKGQEKKCDIKTHEVIMPAQGWNQKRGEMTIAFLDVLSGIGVLNQKKEKQVAAVHGAWAGASTPAYSIFSYSIVPQESVDTTGTKLVRRITTYPVRLTGPLEGKEIHVGRVALHECRNCGHQMPTAAGRAKVTRHVDLGTRLFLGQLNDYFSGG